MQAGPVKMGERALRTEGTECGKAWRQEEQDKYAGQQGDWCDQNWGFQEDQGTGRPRLALCEPSELSFPHPTTPILLSSYTSHC